MAGNTNFPTGLDDNTSLLDVTDGVTALQAAHHNNLKESIKALEVKVGIDNTAVDTTLDYRLGHPTFGHSHDGASGQGVAIVSGAGGATFFEGHPSYAADGLLQMVFPFNSFHPAQGTLNASAWEDTFMSMDWNGNIQLYAHQYMAFALPQSNPVKRYDTRFEFWGGWGMTLPRIATSAIHATFSVEGQIYYDTAADKVKLYTGATWRSLAME